MNDAKKWIMFVDDEPRVLAGLRNLLRRERDQWEMVFALGGEAALAELQKQRFDIVVSDMRMPDMDGATLLAKIKQESPSTVRVMLTGHAESEAILRALPSMHQLLTKPCPAPSLRSVLTRSRSLDALIGDAGVLATVGGLDKLPSPPAMYLELQDVLANGRVKCADVAAVIERDPAIVAKVLQLANSAYFGEGDATCSIERAVSWIGPEQVKYLVLATSSFSGITGETGGVCVDKTQRNARATAALVRRFLTLPDVSEIAFAAALLHDIGHIVMGVGLGAAYRRIYARAETTGQPIVFAERELLQLTHADVGACLLDIWGLPSSIVEAVRYHHDPGSAPEPTREIAAAIHVADAITQASPIDVQSMERAGLNDRVATWCAAAV